MLSIYDGIDIVIEIRGIGRFDIIIDNNNMRIEK